MIPARGQGKAREKEPTLTLLQPDLRPLTARDISYAYSAKSRPARAFIRLMENSTGRLGLMKRATGYEDDMARGMG
eukprot:CAMPEP_0184407366 /NCGR_PEP_ID=MMETSP0738-20130409/2383_1 /TAXON_ID=385413 /ORGANISM="Thalassiosira miniscula, Strain CCMP1093" /LENGTH=75 /DNA_ID=CAMNT_0026764529 /DNA_START=126 /DNA_END=350 /DNA_ORIENTATION=+